MGKFGGMPGGMGNMQNLMKQAAKMQQDMERVKQEAKNKMFEETVGGGAVKAICTGEKEFKQIIIAEDLIESKDTELIQDLVCTAVNLLIKKVDAEMKEELGGFDIPGLM